MRTKPLARRLLLGVAAGVLCSLAPHLAAAQTTLRVAYSQDYVMEPKAGLRWWTGLKQAFEQAHPGVTVELMPIPGAYADLMSKLTLMFRSADPPDVAEFPTLDIGQWAVSGFLHDLSDRAAAAPWWRETPPGISAQTKIDGKYYGVSQGENTQAFVYHKAALEQAGIALPWQPKSWAEVLDAARKVKASGQDIAPLWVTTGTAQGTIGVQNGGGNLLLGSSDPTIRDESGKWVVDSKGLREVLEFYRTAAAEGLLAPASQLLDPNAASLPPSLIKDGQIAITLGANYYAVCWATLGCPAWPEATSAVGIAPIPTREGQPPAVVTTSGGWNLVINEASPNKDLAWAFIDAAQSTDNLVAVALAAGLVPPTAAAAQDPRYLEVSPFQGPFGELLAMAQPFPPGGDYIAWSNGFLRATEALVLDPTLSVDDAIADMAGYVENQLGPDKVVRR